MSNTSDTNNRTPSTTFAWRKVKISPAPQATPPQSPEGRPQALRPGRDAREPLTVTIRYRGGAEAWWELRARGVAYRFPGHVQLHDALQRVTGNNRR